MEMQSRSLRRQKTGKKSFSRTSKTSRAWLTGAVSLAIVVAFLFTQRNAPLARKVLETFQGGIQKRMKLEDVAWEEAEPTNLSARVDRAALEKNAGLKMGAELLNIDLEAVEKSLLASPWIESVQLQKKLPSTLAIRYSVHSARAVGVRKNKLWFISPEGRWIAPVQSQSIDLPVFTSDHFMELSLQWLDALEKIAVVHELGMDAAGVTLRALIEVKAPQRQKIKLIAGTRPTDGAIARLARVLQYAAAHNLALGALDLRFEKKAIARVLE